ncbi:MAG: DUF1570 domain-containing protein [Erythrobacter sp.]
MATPAHADWYEASSENFVIYADDSVKDIRKFAENLERFHQAMEIATGRKLEKPSPSNRVTIYVVGDDRDIDRLVGVKNSAIAGFYVPRAGGSVAFVQDIRFESGYPSFSTVVLLHEYAHHFLISSSRYAMPRWMSEGAAEFFAAAGFDSDGTVRTGRPAQHRAGDLYYASDVSVAELLDHELYAKRKSTTYDAFYGRSWLLFHYLTFSETRKGQLSQYWLELARGAPAVEAAKKVFGDFAALEKELDKYLKQRRMYEFKIPPGAIQLGPISLRALTQGEAKAMPLVIRSKRGVDKEEAAEVVADMRKVAAAFPDDAGVLSALAEAEFDSGNHDAAIAAADRAIAIDPAARNAYVQKGYALFAKAGEAEDVDAAYATAMKPFNRLNAIENDHPLPLIYYYRSYNERGREPSENAKHALERAYQLAQFDHSLATNVAMMQAGEGKILLAAETLAPVAADPHGGGLAKYAQDMITSLRQSTEGEPFDFAAFELLRSASAASEGPAAGNGEEPNAEE